MKHIKMGFFWLLVPENSSEDGQYRWESQRAQYSCFANFIKVVFWYCLALILGLVIGNLQ